MTTRGSSQRFAEEGWRKLVCLIARARAKSTADTASMSCLLVVFPSYLYAGCPTFVFLDCRLFLISFNAKSNQGSTPLVKAFHPTYSETVALFAIVFPVLLHMAPEHPATSSLYGVTTMYKLLMSRQRLSFFYVYAYFYIFIIYRVVQVQSMTSLLFLLTL